MRKDPREKIEWRKAEDCCLTEAGRQKPTVSIDVSISNGASGLTVTVTTGHACGITDYAMSVKVKGPGDTDWWNFRQTGVDPDRNEWKWGPNEADQLPVPSLTELFIYVAAFSTCDTMGSDRVWLLIA